MSLEPKSNELVKHSAAIHISGELTLAQRKISNALLKNAYHNLLKQERHSISLAFLMTEIGYNSNNIKFLKRNITSLMGTIIDWNILGKDNKHEWLASTLIASVRIKSGIIEYAYSSHLREILVNPNIYAKLNLVIQRSIKSTYSLILWEFFTEILCSSGKNKLQTEWYSIDQYKKILGIKANEYIQFKMLNYRLINQPIKELNKVTDIEAEVLYQRSSRKIVAVSFKISKKELNLHSQDLLLPKQSVIVDLKEQNLINNLIKKFKIPKLKVAKLLKTHSLLELEQAIEYLNCQFNQNTKIKNITAFAISTIEDKWYLQESEKDLSSIIRIEIESIKQQITNKYWLKVFELIQIELDIGIFKSWICQLEFIAIKHDTIYYLANSKFVKNTIETRFKSIIIRNWQKVKSSITDLIINIK